MQKQKQLRRQGSGLEVMTCTVGTWKGWGAQLCLWAGAPLPSNSPGLRVYTLLLLKGSLPRTKLTKHPLRARPVCTELTWSALVLNKRRARVSFLQALRLREAELRPSWAVPVPPCRPARAQ